MAIPAAKKSAAPLPQWHVLYVRSRSEKKVKERMDKKNIKAFLPLMKVVKQWSDRKKQVQVPLFGGYIFVRITPDDYTQVRMIEGVVNFVRQENKNAVIRDEEIASIQQFLDTGLPVTASTDHFDPGEQVRIQFGPLTGHTGELVEVRNEKQFIVRISVIQQALIVSVPLSYLEKVQ